MWGLSSACGGEQFEADVVGVSQLEDQRSAEVLDAAVHVAEVVEPRRCSFDLGAGAEREADVIETRPGELRARMLFFAA